MKNHRALTHESILTSHRAAALARVGLGVAINLAGLFVLICGLLPASLR